MTSLVPDHQTVLSLEERRVRIIAHVEQAAIHVGEELLAAKAEHPGRFMAWVEAELPFGIDKAERLMAITRAFRTADQETLKALPSAYSALFELSRMPTDRLNEAIANGSVTPATTVRAARDMALGRPPALPDDPPEVDIPPVRSEPRISVELVAKELMRFPRDQLSEETEVALRRWLR